MTWKLNAEMSRVCKNMAKLIFIESERGAWGGGVTRGFDKWSPKIVSVLFQLGLCFRGS